MCETTLLLKELKENPICLCHSSNSNLLEVPIDNELGCSAHKENIKCLKRSKQLLIYNEKGCMKGIELNKDNNSDGSSAFHDLQITSNYIPIHETDTFAEDCTDKNFQPSNSFLQNVERNVSFVSKPRYNFDSVDSGSSQPYTHYIVKKPVRRNKPLINRGQRKSTKKQPKQLHNVASSISNLRRDGEHPVPCTVLEKQSYTQVSVEEVHVAQSSSGSRRPRRNVRKKSASEMLMMRRKIKKQIVQSTSIEYQPKNMNQKQFTSSMDPKITVHREKNAGIKKRSPRKSKGKAVKTNMRRFSELEKYGPEILPPGWNMQITKRKSGKSAGQIDIYFLTPEGKRLRSRIEMAKYLVKNSLPFSAEEFCFRRSAYQNMLTYNPV